MREKEKTSMRERKRGRERKTERERERDREIGFELEAYIKILIHNIILFFMRHSFNSFSFIDLGIEA